MKIKKLLDKVDDNYTKLTAILIKIANPSLTYNKKLELREKALQILKENEIVPAEEFYKLIKLYERERKEE